MLAELLMSVYLGGRLLPFDLQLLKCTFEVLLDVLVRIRSKHSRRNLKLPPLTTVIAINPIRLSQRRLLAVLVNSVYPETHAQRILHLHGLDSDSLLTILDASLIIRPNSLNAPVGPSVACNS